LLHVRLKRIELAEALPSIVKILPPFSFEAPRVIGARPAAAA
jgi:hypothetical protein